MSSGNGNAAALRLKALAARLRTEREEQKTAIHIVAGGIEYNAEQNAFISAGLTGESVCLIGPAGTGKTTSLRGLLESLIQSPRIHTFDRHDHRYLPAADAPAIVCTSFTNKAVENMKGNLPKDLRANVITLHKLLEFSPVWDTVFDPISGKEKRTVTFEPLRTGTNPLSAQIQVIVIDEPSMVPVSLWNLLAAALKHSPQIIFLGDIQQLPPVFGKSVMIHALAEGIHRVELTQVYRQALESPIISLAHRILSGKPIPVGQLKDWNIENHTGSLTIKPWKQKVSDLKALAAMHSWLPAMISRGEYDPYNHAILTPYNKAFGTIEMNRIIANHLAKTEGTPVYEIYAGRFKKYFRIGEKVLYNKTEWRITGISRNGSYYGPRPRAASSTLDYAGVDTAPPPASFTLAADEVADVDDFLEHLATEPPGKESDPASRMASHSITLYSELLDEEEVINTAGDVNKLDLAYAITVHKSQGSQYEKVFFITHQSQRTMLFRELLYTAVTRAKRDLYIVCHPEMFIDGILSQRLPGTSLSEKLTSFERYIANARGIETELPKRTDLFKPRQGA